MDYNMNGNYGVSKGVRAVVKIGFMALTDLLTLLVLGMLGVQGNKLFPPDQTKEQLVYWGLLIFLGAYSIVKPHNSYHKNTYMLLLWFNKRPRRFRSMNRYEEL